MDKTTQQIKPSGFTDKKDTTASQQDSIATAPIKPPAQGISPKGIKSESEVGKV